MTRIGGPKAKHLYEVEVQNPNPYQGACIIRIEVDADHSSQAGSIARKAGYKVRSVNMIG